MINYSIPDLFESIPSDMRLRGQWVTWILEPDPKRDGKFTKVLYNAMDGYHASSTDLQTWCSFDYAVHAYKNKKSSDGRSYTGIGYVFNKDETGIDLDHCIDEHGDLDAWAREYIDRFASYTEISPSGTGAHIVTRGVVPGEKGMRRKVANARDPEAAIELYCQGRYFTVTGNHLAGTPTEVEDRQEVLTAVCAELSPPKTHKKSTSSSQTPFLTDNQILDKAMDAKNSSKFRNLYLHGDTNGYLSASEADLGLCIMLAFWSGKDANTMDRLFRRSALYRDKWDEMHGAYTYGNTTIASAIDRCQETYTGFETIKASAPKSNGNRHHAEEASEEDESQGRAASQASVLRQLALDNIAELFTTPGGEKYARIRRNGHMETLPVNERKGAFKSWLIWLYGNEIGSIPNSTALSSAIAALEAETQFGDHPEYEVYLRIAEHEDKLYLDLGNKEHEVVEIDADGWRVIDRSPVFFKRPGSMTPLPQPVKGGKIDEIERFVNVDTKEDRMLMLAWLVGCFHPTGPYPVLNLHGERGAAKSTTTHFLRRLIDPSLAPMRKEPEDDRTLAVLAHNNRVVAFDNLSHMESWLSDALCRLATGAGDSYRKNYSDDEEVVFNAKRPIILNGIEEIATRGDLLDRSITVNLPAIKPQDRKSEKTYWKEVEEAHPRILGAILDIVSVAIRNLPHVKVTELPRMADFALWIQACEHMIADTPGAFLEAYNANRDRGISVELEASQVSSALIQFMSDRNIWEGSATDLLAELKKKVSEETQHLKEWPKVARSLSGKLKRLSPSLRTIGIDISIGRGNQGSVITITKNDPETPPTSDAKVTQNKKSDAKHSESDAKKSSCVTAAEEENSDFTQKVTQSDANRDDFSLSSEKIKDKREEEGIVKKDSPGLRHFASLGNGQWVNCRAGIGQIVHSSASLVTVDVMGKRHNYYNNEINHITVR